MQKQQREPFIMAIFNMLQGQLGYRYQPYINFAVNFNYTDIHLPEPFERTGFWLLGPKLDVTFSENIFWTTFVQYNEQMDNMNVNMRFSGGISRYPIFS
jgi:hypothetical protein